MRFEHLFFLTLLSCAEVPEAGTFATPEAGAPPAITVHVDAAVRIGAPTTITVDGALGHGERVYLGGRVGAAGAGPCLPTAGGVCLSLGGGAKLVGTALAGPGGSAAFQVTIPAALPDGAVLTVQALTVRGFGGVDSLASAPVTFVAVDGPAEGEVLTDWTAFDFDDDGYRDGCVGGDKYVRSTGYASAPYVGVTVCTDRTYKIWLSDALYGTFHSAGDWSGSGEDQCEYVGGTYAGFPQGSTSVDSGASCWSRGPAGVEPVFEATCVSNRWIAPVHDCTVRIPPPPGPAEGSFLADWTAFDFLDDGYRDGCAGGDKYIMSTPWADPAYVGVTLCNATTYKIWLGDTIYGEFVSVGDWSGSGEDQCEYVGGAFVSFPQGSNSVDAGQSCWSRGPAGAQPVYEATCAANRWVPAAHTCTAALP